MKPDADQVESKANAAVFEQEATVINWDEDYYHPIAISYYDVAIPQILRDMGAKRGDRVLDAGCGPGVHSIRAANYGCNVVAVDLSQTMLDKAQERAQMAGVSDKITFQQADLTQDNLEERFDFVFSWGVIIHIPDTKAALHGLAKAVAPDGKLALQVLNENSIDYKFEKLLRSLLRRPFAEPVATELGSGNWYSYNGERLWVLRFDMKALDAAMRERGFKLVTRGVAEFTEIQRRLPGFFRWPVLQLNRALFRLGVGTKLSATQIVIYSLESN